MVKKAQKGLNNSPLLHKLQTFMVINMVFKKDFIKSNQYPEEKSIEFLEEFGILKKIYKDKTEMIERIERGENILKNSEQYTSEEKVFIFSLASSINRITDENIFSIPTSDSGMKIFFKEVNIEEIIEKTFDKFYEITKNLGHYEINNSDNKEINTLITPTRYNLNKADELETLEESLNEPMEITNPHYMDDKEKLKFILALTSVNYMQEPTTLHNNKHTPIQTITIQQAYNELIKDKDAIKGYKDELEDGFKALSNWYNFDLDKVTIKEFYNPNFWDAMLMNADQGK